MDMIEFCDINIFSVYQPIFSLKTLNIIGFEALCRGKKENEILSPATLFSKAKEENTLCKLELSCRESALFYFKNSKYTNKILFLNLSIELVNDKNQIQNLIDLVSNYKLNPKYICIEILESKIEDIKSLLNIIKMFKYYGFLIALDDFGVGHSNFERLCYIKPDIIKIDMSLIRNIEHNYNKQLIVKHISSLGHDLGSLVLAEGIENDEELYKCIDLGLDMFQGFLLSKPQNLESINMSSLEIDFKTKIDLNTIKRFNEYTKYIEKLDIFKKIFRKISSDSLDQNRFLEYIKQYDFIQAIYLLDYQGNLVYDTIYQRNHIKSIFKPAKRGDNLSHKNYFMFTKFLKSDIYISEPYISQINGKPCITISGKVKDKILCIDFSL